QRFVNPAETSSDQKAFDNITRKVHGVTRVNNEMPDLSSKTSHIENMKMLIISEDLAKQKGTLINLLDHYIRDVKIRRGAQVVVSKDSAKSMLDFQQPENDLPALNIKQLLEHGSDKSGFFKPLVIGDVQEHFINNRSFILPYFTIKDQIEWTAATVYQRTENKMVCLINEKELQGLHIYSGNVIQKIIDFKYKNDTFGQKIVRIKRKKSIDTTNIN